MFKKIKSILFCSAVLVLGSCSVLNDEIISMENAGAERSVTVEKSESFSYKAVSTANPLKGFANWGTSNKAEFPYSLSYLPVNFNEVVSAKGVYDFSYLENLLNSYSKKGVQAIIRFVIDEPGKELFLPSSIKSKIKIVKYTRDGVTGESPDYHDQELINIINDVIVAFGKKYDGDARIACVQTGFIGHWGEWHTYYCEKSGIDAMPSSSQQKSILNTFTSSFKKTCVVIRRPNIPGMDTNTKIGIYNDMFYSDSDDNYMVKLFDKADLWDRWQTGMVTGEFAPALQEDFIKHAQSQSYVDKFKERLNLFHNSSIMVSKLFKRTDLSSSQKKQLLSLSNSMGYDLYVSKASVKKDGSDYILEVTIKNKGVAPFYYNWPVTVALYNDGIKSKATTDWKISKVAAGGKKTFTYNLGKKYSSSDKILLRIKNPMENGYPVRFSNEKQDKHVSGYLTLF